MSQHFTTLLVGTAIATLSSIAPAYAAPDPQPPSRSAADLGGVVTPFCPNNQPFPFPTDKCPTGETINLDQNELNELGKQIHDRIQQVRRSAESDKILVPLIEIKF